MLAYPRNSAANKLHTCISRRHPAPHPSRNRTSNTTRRALTWSCHAMSCHVMSCHVVSCRVILPIMIDSRRLPSRPRLDEILLYTPSPFVVGQDFDEQTAVPGLLPRLGAGGSNPLHHRQLQRRVHPLEGRFFQLRHYSTGTTGVVSYDPAAVVLMVVDVAPHLAAGQAQKAKLGPKQTQSIF